VRGPARVVDGAVCRRFTFDIDDTEYQRDHPTPLVSKGYRQVPAWSPRSVRIPLKASERHINHYT